VSAPQLLLRRHNPASTLVPPHWLSLHGPTAAVSAVSHSPDGQTVCAGCHDGRAYVWSADGRLLAVLDPQRPSHSGVTAACFNIHGELATACDDGSVAVWLLGGGGGAPRCIALPPVGAGGASIQCVAWSPDGEVLAAAADNGLTGLWARRGFLERADGEEGAPLPSDNMDVTVHSPPPPAVAGVLGSAALCALCFECTGEGFVTVDRAGVMRRWKLAVRRLTHSEGRALSMVDNPVLLATVSVTVDGTPLCCAAASPTQHSCATADDRGVVCVWDLEALTGAAEPGAPGTADTASPDAKPLFVMRGHGASAQAIGYTPDGFQVVSGSEDETVRVWCARTVRRPLRPFCRPFRLRCTYVASALVKKYRVATAAARARAWGFSRWTGGPTTRACAACRCRRTAAGC
jgi:WD40 repeat protein